MRGDPGFFDVDERLKHRSDLGDHLEAFGLAVDFQMFRADLAAMLSYCGGTRGGRPPFDPDDVQDPRYPGDGQSL